VSIWNLSFTVSISGSFRSPLTRRPICCDSQSGQAVTLVEGSMNVLLFWSTHSSWRYLLLNARVPYVYVPTVPYVPTMPSLPLNEQHPSLQQEMLDKHTLFLHSIIRLYMIIIMILNVCCTKKKRRQFSRMHLSRQENVIYIYIYIYTGDAHT
jgi:hypothetical protein